MAQIFDAYPELERELKFFPLGADNPCRLTQAQVDHYNQKGYITGLDVFDTDEIARIRRYFDDLLEKALTEGWNSYEIVNWHKHCRGVYDLVTESRILDIVGDLLGETLILRHSHLFAKLPGDGKRVSWHQDASYWPLSPSKVVSAWLAIDDVTLGNAPLCVIPGSHLNAQVGFRESEGNEHNVLNQTVDDPARYGGTPVALTLNAGQMSLHSDWILHGSDPNTSGCRRCGLAMRFLSGEVHAFNGWNAHSIICRGSEPTGHWADNPRPEGEFIPKKHAETEPTSHQWARNSG